MSELQPQAPSELAPTPGFLVGSNIGRIIAGAVLTLEISPLNEVARLAALAYAQTEFGTPLLVAAIYGAASLAIEAPAAVVAADVLATDKGNQYVEKVNKKIEKLGADKFLETNIVTETGIGMIAGSAVQVIVKHRQDTARTRSQNRRYGLKSAASISTISAAQGYLISAGISHPSPTTLGGTTLAVGSLVATGQYVKKKLNNHKSKQESQA